MDKTFDLKISLEPREEEIPAKHETFEAQVLVRTLPRKEMTHPYAMTMPYPCRETERVLRAGKYHVELVMSEIGGKPTLLIYEDGDTQERTQ